MVRRFHLFLTLTKPEYTCPDAYLLDTNAQHVAWYLHSHRRVIKAAVLAMFKFLRVPAFTKLFDGRTTQSTDASDGTQVHSDVQYVPLAPEAEAEVERLQEEMGFDDQYEKPEGRTGDALAQVVAIVSLFCALLCFHPDRIDRHPLEYVGLLTLYHHHS